MTWMPLSAPYLLLVAPLLFALACAPSTPESVVPPSPVEPDAVMRVAHHELVRELEGARWKHVCTDVDTLPHQYRVELVPAAEQ